MSNFIKDFYCGFANTHTLEQFSYDMALNRYCTGCRERLDENSFILIHNCDLYQVIFIDEDTIIIQMVEEKNDNKYELINNTLRIMNVEEYHEFIKETKY